MKQLTKIWTTTLVMCSCVVLGQPAGGLDLSFGNGGKVVTSINNGFDIATSVVIQPDGKIVVAGYTNSSVFGNDFACVRYLTDGSLDSTFGNNGKVSFDLILGSDDRALAMDLQTDGKIVLAGYADDGSDRAGAVIRLNTDGTLDESFGTMGKSFTNFTQFNTSPRTDEFRTVKVHHVTGNIVLAGTSIKNNDESRGVFARLLPNGQPDTTFATDGLLINLPFPESNQIGFSFSIEAIAVKSNGKISAVGWSDVPGSGNLSNSRQYVCRLNANGTLDTTFSNDGFSSNSFTTSDNKSYGIILLPNDSFLFSGHSRWSSTDYRYYYGVVSASGTVSQQGSVDFSTNTVDLCYDMAVDNTPRLILVGSSINVNTNKSNFALARIKNDYSIDNSFGNGGKVITDFGTNINSEAFATAVQQDEKIILVGYAGNDFAVARYMGNEVLSDESFDLNSGFKVFPNPAENIIQISISNLDYINQNMQVVDMHGRIVKEVVLTSNIYSLNITDLTEGVYFLKINHEFQKFVKK